MSKSSHGRFFEDFSLGETIVHATPRTVTQADQVNFIGHTGSRFSLFSDHHYAQQLGFKQQPVDNLLVFHIAFGKTVQDISLNAVANLGYAEVQFLKPVFVDDSLYVSSEVIGLKENSNGKTGIVYVFSQAYNQHNELVLSWKRWVMVHKKHTGEASSFPVTPHLEIQVMPHQLQIPADFQAEHYRTEYSGESYRFDDYQVGEWIDHIDGLSITESIHTQATHSYQNNAKVHFNHHQMAASKHQQPLVYGGHVISLCRAISHNGLANGQWLMAINGGSHLNPSYAGDTIYAASQVIDKYELESGLGALRLKTYGFKNITFPELRAQALDEAEAQDSELAQMLRGFSSTVLELDYTVMIIR